MEEGTQIEFGWLCRDQRLHRGVRYAAPAPRSRVEMTHRLLIIIDAATAPTMRPRVASNPSVISIVDAASGGLHLPPKIIGALLSPSRTTAAPACRTAETTSRYRGRTSMTRSDRRPDPARSAPTGAHRHRDTARMPASRSHACAPAESRGNRRHVPASSARSYRAPAVRVSTAVSTWSHLRASVPSDPSRRTPRTRRRIDRPAPPATRSSLSVRTAMRARRIAPDAASRQRMRDGCFHAARLLHADRNRSESRAHPAPARANACAAIQSACRQLYQPAPFRAAACAASARPVRPGTHWSRYDVATS